MTDRKNRYIGGCLCGALRYEAEGEPLYQGYCCCNDCQKASGSGFVPFVGFAAKAIAIAGAVIRHEMTHKDGRNSVRNSCAACGSLVYGGDVGKSDFHVIYAGTLDDPSLFKPAMAIMTRFKPDWVILPPGLSQFEATPPGR
jgi:hypothetical protein